MKEVDTVTMEALLNECDESGKEEEDNLSLFENQGGKLAQMLDDPLSSQSAKKGKSS